MRANAERTLREEHRREKAAMSDKWVEVLPGAIVLVAIIAIICWSATDLPPAVHYFAAGILAACTALFAVVWWTTRRSR